MNKYAALLAEFTAPPEKVSKPVGMDDTLNAPQLSAVALPLANSALVLAGAGTGKTKTLTNRLSFLINKGVPVSDILVTTFTRAAATEIKQRVPLVSKSANSYIGTAHGLALRTQAKKLRRYSILGEDDALKLFLQSTGLTGAKALDTWSELNRRREDGRVYDEWAVLFDIYSKEMPPETLDFAMVLEQAIESEPNFKFKHVLVDEAQDLTFLHKRWLSSVALDTHVRFFVGDDDQSIYSFRGGDVGDFRKTADMPNSQLITLNDNYRSSPEILVAANNLISHNKDRFPKELNSISTSYGTVTLNGYLTRSEERDHIAKWAQTFKSRTEYVILARTNELLTELKHLNLNCKTVHESKGLEWPNVWIMGLEDGVFPHVLAESLEEERRLMYVAVTRAKQHLSLSYCSRAKSGRLLNVSPFVAETQEFSQHTPLTSTKFDLNF